MPIAISEMVEVTPVAAHATDSTLSELLWRKRVLLVFGQGDQNRTLAQLRILQSEENEARDLVIADVPAVGTVQVVPDLWLDAKALRRSFGITEDASFTVLLIGKDGGVKLRSAEPLSAKTLYDTIDAMPMRRREMQDR